jgi:hypothetical protein
MVEGTRLHGSVIVPVLIREESTGPVFILHAFILVTAFKNSLR